MTMMDYALAPVLALLCPAWCTLPADDHPEILDHDGSVYVIHRCAVPTGLDAPRVELERTTVHAPDGSVAGETTVVVPDGDPTRAVELDEALDLAAALSLAVQLATGGAR